MKIKVIKKQTQKSFSTTAVEILWYSSTATGDKIIYSSHNIVL